MARKRSERERQATAYHEAGHAVVSVDVGLSVKYVAIHLDLVEGNAGVCQGGKSPSWAQPEIDATGRTRRWIEQVIMVLLAGGEAERRFVGRRNHKGASSDYQKAVDIGSYICNGDMEETQAYLAWLAVRTRNLLAREDIWAAVKAVALALLVRSELSGREVKRIIQDSYNALLSVPA
jgi:ATP-dependent Zn protease